MLWFFDILSQESSLSLLSCFQLLILQWQRSSAPYHELTNHWSCYGTSQGHTASHCWTLSTMHLPDKVNFNSLPIPAWSKNKSKGEKKTEHNYFHNHLQLSHSFSWMQTTVLKHQWGVHDNDLGWWGGESTLQQLLKHPFCHLVLGDLCTHSLLKNSCSL